MALLSEEVSNTVIQNLAGLHEYEESFRKDTLALITDSPRLLDHYTILGASMDIIHVLSITHPNLTEDELTLQKLGLRLFNNAATATKLALTGYYQRALCIIRDTIELVFLLDYLRTEKDMITVWGKASTKERKSKFQPAKIREFLDERDGYKECKRKKTYDTFSEYASHASHQGFSLLVHENTKLHTIGPFFSPDFLETTICELARHHTYAAAIFCEHFQTVSSEIEEGKNGFYKYATDWRIKYNAPLKYEDDVMNSGNNPKP